MSGNVCMKEQKPIFGVDLDNVITDTDGMFRRIVEKTYGISIRRDDVLEFYYHLGGKITKEQESEAFRIFHDVESLNVELLEGATDALSELRRRYQVYIVTSRPESARQVTEDFLRNHEVPYDRLVFERRKAELVKGWTAFVEDHRETAYEIAEEGVLTFVFDYPWNRPLNGDPEGIVRVKSWRDVMRHLRGA
jgi:uncharacterized HAD superfamily protein